MAVELVSSSEPAGFRSETVEAVEHGGRNRLLAALPPDEFSLIAPHLASVNLAKGFVVQEAGGAIEQVYFIHGGIISLQARMPEGQSVEIAAIGREGAIGLMVGMGSRTALSRAVVQMPVSAGRMEAGRFGELAQGSKPLRDMILRYADALMAQVQQLVACNAVHDVPARLSRWLLHAEDRCGSTIPVTQELLSQLLGVQRTTVTMVCRNLQMDGLIRIGRGVIHVRDADGLERKACRCYHVLRESTEQMMEKLRYGDAGRSDQQASDAFGPITPSASPRQ
jgi:CRP-like cAMP-binding protein